MRARYIVRKDTTKKGSAYNKTLKRFSRKNFENPTSLLPLLSRNKPKISSGNQIALVKAKKSDKLLTSV
jgi:hypothetical protein